MQHPNKISRVIRPAVCGHTVAFAGWLSAAAFFAGSVYVPVQSETLAATANIQYDIPAGDLGAALNRFAQQAGVAIAVDATQVQGLSTPGLRGIYNVDDGFNRLLRGSGYAIEKSAAGYVLVAAPPPVDSAQAPGAAPETTTLPTVTVTADRDIGNGDTGYAATVASSATRLPADILDTDRAVNVVPRSLIEDRAILDPQEVILNVSGVQRAGNRTGSGESYLVRGFAQSSLFKDSFRAGQTAGSAEPFTFGSPTGIANLERVEILKGPSAIQFGRGEPGGTVNYVTRTPDFDDSTQLQQYIGDFDLYRTEVHVNRASGRFAARLDAAYQTNDSFIDFVEGERTFVAPSLRWNVGPETTFTLLTEHASDQFSTSTGFPVVDGEVLDAPYDRYFGEPGFSEIEADTFRGLATLDHRWNESHATTLSFHHVDSEAEGGNILLFNFFGPLQDPVTGEISRIAEDVDFRSKYFTARLDHIWDSTLYQGGQAADSAGETGWQVDNQVLVSLEFDRQTVDGSRGLSAASPIDPFNPVYAGFTPIPLGPGFPDQFFDDAEVEADATSILLLDRISLNNRWILSFGGRYEWFDATQVTVFSDFFGTSDNETDESTFNPSAGLVFKLLPNLSLYASYAESTFSFQNIAARTVAGDLLDPEQARQYEIGAKVELLDGRFFASTALFDIEKSDVAATDPDNPFFSINGGNERSRGIEFDLGGELSPGWKLTANYSYIDAEVSFDPNGIATGNRLSGVPRNSGGVFSTYEIQSGPLKGFGGGGGIFISDSVAFSNLGGGELDGYEQVDAVIFYKQEGWTAQLNIKNLLDEEYFLSGGGEGGLTEAQRAAERTFIGSISIKF